MRFQEERVKGSNYLRTRSVKINRGVSVGSRAPVLFMVPRCSSGVAQAAAAAAVALTAVFLLQQQEDRRSVKINCG